MSARRVSEDRPSGGELGGAWRVGAGEDGDETGTAAELAGVIATGCAALSVWGRGDVSDFRRPRRVKKDLYIPRTSLTRLAKPVPQ